jgi:CRISPR/Cas system CSM-associated protein Csm2 small subunit
MEFQRELYFRDRMTHADDEAVLHFRARLTNATDDETESTATGPTMSDAGFSDADWYEEVPTRNSNAEKIVEAKAKAQQVVAYARGRNEAYANKTVDWKTRARQLIAYATGRNNAHVEKVVDPKTKARQLLEYANGRNDINARISVNQNVEQLMAYARHMNHS